MWVCLNTGMVSIVEDKDNDQMVFVRARQSSFLTAFMGDSQFEIIHINNRDYQYRIHVAKSYAAFRLAEHALNINYTNFKSSVPDDQPDLKDAYHKVWECSMKSLDERSVHTVWQHIRDK